MILVVSGSGKNMLCRLLTAGLVLFGATPAGVAGPTADSAGKPCVAVLEAEVIGKVDAAERRAMAGWLDTLLTESLAKRKDFVTVDRQALDRVLAEKAAKAGGLTKIDPKDVAASLQPFWSAGVLICPVMRQADPKEASAGKMVVSVEAVLAQTAQLLAELHEQGDWTKGRWAKSPKVSEDLERWMVEKAKDGMSAGSPNGYREACVGFGNWCVRVKRLSENPFAHVPKADARADCRRKRRALTEEELVRLLDAARRRPVLEARTVRRGKSRGKAIAKLRNETRQRLEGLGRERAMIYKTLVLTGLRRKELASITVAQLQFDGPNPYAVLYPSDEKNRKGSKIPLRPDLVEDIRAWLDEKLLVLRKKAIRRGETPPEALPLDTPVLVVPAGLVRILDHDLKLAGIPKKDIRGWTIDVHAMRHTFGTLLTRGNVAPRIAQAAMRHSSIDLTMNVYTDPQLLDVAGALDALPKLPLAGD